LAKAILFTIENEMEDHIYNIGSGEEIKIIDLAHTVRKIIGFNGDIKWDSSMPNGTPRKLLNSNKFNSKGWEHEITIEEGIKSTYQWFLKNFYEN
jgi:GDP-L-fucose synthase